MITLLASLARRPAETAFERYRYQPRRLDVSDGPSDRVLIQQSHVTD